METTEITCDDCDEVVGYYDGDKIDPSHIYFPTLYCVNCAGVVLSP